MMTRSTTISISLLSIALAAAPFLVHTSSAFWLTHSGGGLINSYSSISPFGTVPATTRRNRIHTNDRRQHTIKPPSPTLVSARPSEADDETSKREQPTQPPPPPRQEATIRLAESGKEATLISRTLPVFPNASVTVWEWKNSARVVNAYWEAQGQIMATISPSKPMLDPFGLVSWPGSVLAARELYTHAEEAVLNQNVVILGAGVGVETQAAAMLGPKQVLATDIHPTTLQQLELGVSRNENIPSTVVRTQVLDLYRTKEEQPMPSPCDLLVAADVLYSEQLATQVIRRCAEALEANPNIKILITDSQRFVPTFLEELNEALARVATNRRDKNNNDNKPIPQATWKVETMKNFEGSGVIIDEDQTYDVTVQSLWIGL
jgi:predicted nicotinamide N-methyase